MTGANSAVGRALVALAIERDVEVVAAVRSERAERELPPIPTGAGRVARIDYSDGASLRAACGNAAAVVHMPGILFETPASSYESANLETTRATLEAARAGGVAKFVFISVVGAAAESTNRYYQTKGEAEAAVLGSGLAATVLRAPLVMGRDTAGSAVLRARLGARTAWMPGASTLHQPIDIRDLVAGALHAALDPDVARGEILELVGPECVSMRELLERAATLAEKKLSVVEIPAALVGLAARAKGAISPYGMNATVFEVLHDDCKVDPAPAAKALGIHLHSLDDTLRASLAPTGVEEDP